MNRILKVWLFPCSTLLLTAALVMAADTSWKTKQINQWTENEARQFLAKSPWVQKATPGLLPKQSEAARRQGGKMGGSQGPSIQAITAGSLFGTAPTHAARPSLLKVLEIRWESAAPVRAAEIKTHEEDSPEVPSNTYAIAVYDVPGLDIAQKGLAGDLRRDASLGRDGKKDLKPSQVDLLPQANGLTTVVYLFPRSEPITLEDKRIMFTAVFDHVAVAQYFYTKDMQFQGKLEL
jgi:hypothetical protein